MASTSLFSSYGKTQIVGVDDINKEMASYTIKIHQFDVGQADAAAVVVYDRAGGGGERSYHRWWWQQG